VNAVLIVVARKGVYDGISSRLSASTKSKRMIPISRSNNSYARSWNDDLSWWFMVVKRRGRPRRIRKPGRVGMVTST
jgi:hypothetical protein